MRWFFRNSYLALLIFYFLLILYDRLYLICSGHYFFVYYYIDALLLTAKDSLPIRLFVTISCDCMFLSCHVRISEWTYTPYLPECQGTPCLFVYELSGCGFESSCSHLNFMWVCEQYLFFATYPCIPLAHMLENLSFLLSKHQKS